MQFKNNNRSKKKKTKRKKKTEKLCKITKIKPKLRLLTNATNEAENIR